MRISEFCDAMEKIAPAALAYDFDNVGLLVGTTRHEIKKALVALDCSTNVVAEAVEWGADIVVTHHPLLFHGTKRMLPDDPQTAAVFALVQANIAMFAAHTNLDSADGGVSDSLAAAIGLVEVKQSLAERLVRVGELPAAMTLDEFAKNCKDKLGTVIRVHGDGKKSIKRVALCSGEGGEFFSIALDEGADVYVTGDVRRHEAIAAQECGMCIVEAGHYETERVVLLPLIRRLQSATNDVEYRLTHSETACLRGI